MKTIRLKRVMPKAKQEKLGGEFASDNDYDLLIQQDANILKPDGTPLLMFRKGILDRDECGIAYESLIGAAAPSSNRGMAGGKVEDGTREYRIRKDGTRSKTNHAKITVNSGIVGSFDRGPRFPYCRQTAYTMANQDKFKAAIPFIRSIDQLFHDIHPARHEAQMKMARGTNRDFRIADTCFTTITVNKNFRTAIHKDQGDYAGGFGVMTVLEAGKYEGAYLVFPAYRVAVDMRTTDLILADVHEWHGNSPIIGIPGRYVRLSLVLYYRDKMFECGSQEEELNRVKRIRQDTTINEAQAQKPGKSSGATKGILSQKKASDAGATDQDKKKG